MKQQIIQTKSHNQKYQFDNLLAKEKVFRSTALASIFTLGAIGSLLIFPTTSSDTNATTDSSLNISVHAATNLSLSVDPEVSIEATDTGFTSGSAAVKVSSNNRTGYTLYLNTANGEDTLSDASNIASSQEITSIPTSTTGSAMPGNTWGYTLDTDEVSSASLFNPIPTTLTAIKATSTNSGTTDNYNLGFGIHTDHTLSSGSYSNQVILSVVANYVQPNITDISTMQAITPEICSATSIGTETQLTDTRDHKNYFVTKLKDEQCWMTQNLAYEFNQYDGNGNQIYLTPADSDVTTNWAIPANAKSIGTAGDYGTTNLDMWIGNNVTNDHSSSGNYYQWGAATAGSGNNLTTDGAIAESSICPKGWRLPTDAEYQNLLNGLSIESIKSAPYHFAPSGKISYNDGMLTNYSFYGFYWTSVSYSNIGAQRLYVTENGFDVTAYDLRPFGFSIRCIAK